MVITEKDAVVEEEPFFPTLFGVVLVVLGVVIVVVGVTRLIGVMDLASAPVLTLMTNTAITVHSDRRSFIVNVFGGVA